MMTITKKEIKDGFAHLEITVPKEDLVDFLKKAGERISKNTNIKGFRKGRAPYDVVKKEVGEDAILQEASQEIISQTYYDAVMQEKLETVGRPDIQITKIAANNDLIYTAKVALLPEVKLGDIAKVKIENKMEAVTDKDVDDVLDALRKKRAKEKAVMRAAKMGDRVKLDFTVKQGGVVIEGGQAKDHTLELGSGTFIPGFEEQVVGMNIGDERTFTLNFPEKYHEKSLAGKPADFTVKVREIFEMELPEINDEFAKSLGNAETVAELKKRIKENMTKEREEKESQRKEMDAMDQLIKITTFTDIPQVLIDAEVDQMLGEMKSNIAQQGMKFEDYLQHLKKTEDDFKNEFTEQAERRVKASLVARAITQEQKLEVSDDELEAEMKKVLEAYEKYPDMQKQFDNDNYRNYTKNMMLYRKVFQYILAQATPA